MNVMSIEELKLEAVVEKCMKAAEVLLEGKSVSCDLMELRFLGVNCQQVLTMVSDQLRYEVGPCHPEDEQVEYKIYGTLASGKFVIKLVSFV